jgi:hypothetical protein
MPDPNGDGHGSPNSNVASIALSGSIAVSSESAQSHGAEAGIIIVSGHDPLTDGGSFWDQAASHAGSTAAAGVSSASASTEGSAIHAAAFEASTASIHDFSSVAADLHTATHDQGAANTTFSSVHADFASMAHFEAPSLAGGEFAHQLHI